MQEVILVREDNHGLIAVTLDYFSAVKYLVENNWLTDTIEVGADEDLEEVIVAFGADWVDEILTWDSVQKFNEVFEGVFHLSIEEVYDGSAE